jgi:preprotein translocase subunit SecG
MGMTDLSASANDTPARGDDSVVDRIAAWLAAFAAVNLIVLLAARRRLDSG